MLITGRHARTHLEGAGVGSRQARQVLASGLAGVHAESAWAHYYESEAVLGLVARPVLVRADLQAAFPHGLLVVRRIVDLTSTPSEQRRALSEGWGFSPVYRGWISARLDRHGPLPVVATLGSFVVLCSDLVEAVGEGEKTTLRLTAPGPWLSQVEHSRIPLGPGREWALLGFPWPDPARSGTRVS